MTTYTVKLGRNRGKRRIWLEGKRLSDNGWQAKETPYFVDRTPTRSNRPTLRLVRSWTGDKRVSGKADKPIIDICTVWLEDFFWPDTERLEVSITRETITIRPEGY